MCPRQEQRKEMLIFILNKSSIYWDLLFKMITYSMSFNCYYVQWGNFYVISHLAEQTETYERSYKTCVRLFGL